MPFLEEEEEDNSSIKVKGNSSSSSANLCWRPRPRSERSPCRSRPRPSTPRESTVSSPTRVSCSTPGRERTRGSWGLSGCTGVQMALWSRSPGRRRRGCCGRWSTRFVLLIFVFSVFFRFFFRSLFRRPSSSAFSHVEGLFLNSFPHTHSSTALLPPLREAHRALDPSGVPTAAAAPARRSPSCDQRQHRPRPPATGGQERSWPFVRRVPVLAAQADPEAADVNEENEEERIFVIDLLIFFEKTRKISFRVFFRSTILSPRN